MTSADTRSTFFNVFYVYGRFKTSRGTCLGPESAPYLTWGVQRQVFFGVMVHYYLPSCVKYALLLFFSIYTRSCHLSVCVWPGVHEQARQAEV